MTTLKTFDKRAYRDALGAFVTGVTIVTCNGPDGPIGMTVNSFTSLSLDPPLVLWSPAKSSRRYSVFMNASEYAIHIASYKQLGLCLDFAKSATGSNAVQWQHKQSGSPYFLGGIARFMCEKYTTFDGGDHTIIVGKVTEFQLTGGNPLIFKDGEYIRG
jgi:flavin reductase (DIM6/NTAB) family NADH-FMN oxidoreductase RutF